MGIAVEPYVNKIVMPENLKVGLMMVKTVDALRGWVDFIKA
ncbi:MAG: hypothetical protein ACE5R3_01460 [Nitrosopumilaceae archaeon]